MFDTTDRKDPQEFVETVADRADPITTKKQDEDRPTVIRPDNVRALEKLRELVWETKSIIRQTGRRRVLLVRNRRPVAPQVRTAQLTHQHHCWQDLIPKDSAKNLNT